MSRSTISSCALPVETQAEFLQMLADGAEPAANDCVALAAHALTRRIRQLIVYEFPRTARLRALSNRGAVNPEHRDPPSSSRFGTDVLAGPSRDTLAGVPIELVSCIVAALSPAEQDPAGAQPG